MNSKFRYTKLGKNAEYYLKKEEPQEFMKETLHFRAVCDHDLPNLEQMIFALYREDEYGEVMSCQKIQHTVQELMQHPEKGRIIVFCLGKAVVGYSIVIYYWSNEYGGNIAVINELYIQPQCRGKGIDTCFLEYIVAVGGGSVKGLQLEVTPVNEKAFAYYCRQDFEPEKNRHLFKKLR
jgi:ribosomal protein S18 acetylase RimI-like enzyme